MEFDFKNIQMVLYEVFFMVLIIISVVNHLWLIFTISTILLLCIKIYWGKNKDD